MQHDELLARLVAQQDLLPAAQVQQLFPAFQRSQTESSDPRRDFLAFLVASKLVEPEAARALRERLSQHLRAAAPRPSEARTALIPSTGPAPTQIESAGATAPALSATLIQAKPGPLLEASAHRLRQIGPYDVIRELGRGGMGVVYEARHRTLDRHVALKMLRERDVFNHESIERFKIEARAMAKLEHPNIIRIYEIGEDPEGVYMAMAFAKGGALSTRLRGGQRLEPKEAAVLIQKVALGLAHAHDRNIIHRDLKPDNILLSEEGTPRITDFGLAKALDHDSVKLSRTGQVMGTLAYMAPEQLDGKSKNHDRRSDIYALGVTFYEMLTGRLPHLGDGQLDLAKKIMFAEPERPTSLCQQLPESLETIVLRALVKEPELRYQSAGELAEDLERWLNNERIAARPIGALERFRRWRRRRGKLWAKRAGVVFLAWFIGAISGQRGALRKAEEAREEAETLRAARAELEEKLRERARAAGDLEGKVRDARKALAEEAARSERLTGELEAARQARGRRLALAGATLRQGRSIPAHSIDFAGGEAAGEAFVGVSFSDCRFRDVDWRGLDLSRSRFKDCRLISGTLTGCTLGGDLEGLEIRQAVAFENCRYRSDVRWPQGFDPAGLRGLEPLEPRAKARPKPEADRPRESGPPAPGGLAGVMRGIRKAIANKDPEAARGLLLGELLPRLRSLKGVAVLPRVKRRAGEVLRESLALFAGDYEALQALKRFGEEAPGPGGAEMRAAVSRALDALYLRAAEELLSGQPALAARFVLALEQGGALRRDQADLAALVAEQYGYESFLALQGRPVAEGASPLSEALANKLADRAKRAAQMRERAFQSIEEAELRRLRGGNALLAAGEKELEEAVASLSAAQPDRGALESKILFGRVWQSLNTALRNEPESRFRGSSKFPMPYRVYGGFETRLLLERVAGSKDDKALGELLFGLLGHNRFNRDLWQIAVTATRGARTPHARFLRSASVCLLGSRRYFGQAVSEAQYREVKAAVDSTPVLRRLARSETAYLKTLNRLAKKRSSAALRRCLADRMSLSWLASNAEVQSLMGRIEADRPHRITGELSCSEDARIELTIGEQSVVCEAGQSLAFTLAAPLNALKLSMKGRLRGNQRYPGGRLTPVGVTLRLRLPDGTVYLPDPDRFELVGAGQEAGLAVTGFPDKGGDLLSRGPAIWCKSAPWTYAREWEARATLSLLDFRRYAPREKPQDFLPTWTLIPVGFYHKALSELFARFG